MPARGGTPKLLSPTPFIIFPLLRGIAFRLTFAGMYRRLSILFFLVGVFTVLSVSSASACGKSTTASCGAARSARSCCETREESKEAPGGEHQGTCDKSHPGQACPGHDGCGGEHCPCGCMATAGSSGGLLADVPLLSSYCTYKKLRKQAFYFADHIPEAVYLPIWQPPQLAA